MKQSLILLTFLFLNALATDYASAEGEVCEHLFQDRIQRLTPERLSKLNIPFYQIQIKEKSVPVILVNRETYDLVKPLFSDSIGFQVMSKAGWPNDHGSFRYGEILVDAFLAGQRQVGEINETGLSFKTAKDSAIFLDKIADIIGEVSISVTRSEMNTVDFYEKVRRMALFRIPFLMGDQKIYTKFDNVLGDCGGYCFDFSHSRNLRSQMLSLSQKLDEIDPQSTIRTKFNGEISNYLSRTQSLINSLNLFSNENLNERYLISGELQKISSEFLPPDWEVRRKQLFLNYLVGMDATSKMNEFMNSININTIDPIQLLSANRVDALFVWDPSATPDSFLKGTYSGKGRTFSIPKGN